MPQARFNVYLDADATVRVKLNPGQCLAWQRERATEEGWEAWGERYTLEGDTVRLEWFTDGRDCDGRLSQSGVSVCRLDALDAHECDWGAEVHHSPAWRPVDARQRDYTAEAAGY